MRRWRPSQFFVALSSELDKLTASCFEQHGITQRADTSDNTIMIPYFLTIAPALCDWCIRDVSPLGFSSRVSAPLALVGEPQLQPVQQQRNGFASVTLSPNVPDWSSISSLHVVDPPLPPPRIFILALS